MNKIIHEIKQSIKIKRISDLFRTNITENINIFHSNYLFVFLIESFLFFILSIYLYNSSKNYNKNIDNNVISAPRGVKEKYELTNFLSKAVIFRCFTFIYFIIFSNKTSYDLISYINYLLHIFPSFMFLISLYINIGYLIERFYEILLKRMFILTSLKFILYFSLSLIILLSVGAIIFRIYKECYFFIESIMCLNFVIIGILYFVYGRKIANYMKEVNNIKMNNLNEIKDIRNIIHYKLIRTCFLICPSYIIIGSIRGLVAIDFFGTWYPNFIDLNLYDSIVFFFCELLPSFVIGKKNKNWNTFKIEELCNQQMMSNEYDPLIIKEEKIDNTEHNKTVEEQMNERLELYEGQNN